MQISLRPPVKSQAFPEMYRYIQAGDSSRKYEFTFHLV
ncbi:hypothetical protein CSC02_3981 [Enterobacter hormaechei subsp. hoffmannii]|nr:hypothetical protein CSC02_3981 [Enterobacter hormaechei subsp. hoffmannii]